MIELRLLGTLGLTGSDGREVRSVLVQPKRLALLAYLAAASPREFHRRDTLLALFWAERDLEHARAALSRAVYYLRHSLGEGAILSRGSEELGLARDHCWCDVVAFDSAIANGSLEEALSLYQGDFLPGFFLTDAPEFERWVETERDRLARSCNSVLETLAEAEEARGRLAAAAEHWRNLATRDPYNSRIAIRLMRSLEASGDRAGALQHVHLHTTLLKSEFGVEPHPEVIALAERLRHQPVARMAGPEAASDALGNGPDSTAEGERDRVPTTAAESGTPPGHGVTRRERATRQRTAVSVSLPFEARSEPALTVDNRPTASTELVGAPTRATPTATHGAPRRAWLIGAATLALVAGVAVATLLVRERAGVRVPTTVVRNAATPAITSVAVLPFANLSADEEDEYFADGMTDELASALANIEGLRVAGRNSAFAFKGKHVDAPSLGRALSVGALLEGSVRRSRGRVRVATQLVSAADGLTLWSHTYEREARDVFAVQDEIARSVAAALRLTLRGTTGAAGTGPSLTEHLTSWEAHDLYLRGLYHYRKVTEPDLRRSISLFEEALAHDSAYAQAWAGLSLAWQNLADDWVPPREAYPKARAAAERALALDPALAQAHTALGGVLMLYDWRFDAAEREFLRALELSPNNSDVGLFYSNLLASTGRADSALALARRAHGADPLYTDLSTGLGYLLRVAGRYDEAMSQYRAVLEMEPERAEAWRGIGSILVAQGRLEEGLAAYRRVPGKGVQARVAAAVTLAQLGRRDEARRELASIVAESRRRYVRAEEIAAVYSALGERDSAFAWLGRALRDRSAGLGALENPAVARYWDPIRSDPRFLAVLRRVGLRPWRSR